MTPQIAMVIFGLGILGLFYLDRDRKVRVSKALWIPTIWFFIASSRNVAEWFNTGPRLASAYADGNALDRNVLGLLIGSGIVVLISRSGRFLALWKQNVPFLLYILYCLFSLLWSEYPEVGIRRWGRLLGDLIMVSMIYTDVDPVNALRKVLTRVAFIAMPASVMLIRYFSELGRSYDKTGSVFWTGISDGKNGLGVICFVYGAVIIWRILEVWQAEGARQYRRLAAYFITLALALWLIRIADSMTSIACLTLSGGLIICTRTIGFFRRRTVLPALIAVAVIVPMSVLFLGVGGEVLETMGRDPTLTGRTAIWKIALRFTQNPIVGAGYEGFWLGPRLETIAKLYTYMNQAHNGYLEVYLNLGWVGLCLLGGIIVNGYRNILAGFRGTMSDAASLKLAFFVTALVYNCTEAAFKFMYPAWGIFLLANIATPAPRAKADPPAEGKWFRLDGPPVEAPSLATPRL